MSESKQAAGEIEKVINKYLMQWGLVIIANNGGEEIETGGLAEALSDKFHIIPKSDPPEKWVKMHDKGIADLMDIKLQWRGEK